MRSPTKPSIEVVIPMRPPLVPSTDQRPRRSSRVLQQSQSSLSSCDPSDPFHNSDTSSRRKKRKRAASGHASSGAPASQASSFTAGVKKEIRKESSGERCWHCGDEGLDVAHVLASAERHTFELLAARGLITLQHLQEKQNGLPLCPSCHRHFDIGGSPDWVFFPQDLRYFIDEERADMVGRRGSWERDQIVQCRKPPTAIAYMENQKQRKKLLPGARWGSYDCYTVREFGPQGKEFRKGHTVTKPWHGDPMAALDRAFRAIIYHAANLPTRLQMLHRLYQDNDVRMARLQGRATASEQDDEDLGSRRGDDPTDEEGSSSDEDDADNGRTNGDHGESRHSLRLEKKRHGGSQQRRKQGHQEEVLLQLSSSRKPTAVMQEEPFARPVPCKRRRTRYERWDWDWDFGPDFTAQDAVGFFGYFNGGGYVDNGPWAKPVEKGRGVTTIQQGLPSPGKSREIR